MRDFSQTLNRFDTCSLKWNVMKNELPMWVADMDFQVAKEITEALHKVLQHGIFGYTVVPELYFESIMTWWQRRYCFAMQRQWLLFARGVIPAISCIIRHFTDEGDSVLLQSPVYHVFYRCIEENQREVLNNALLYRNGDYEIDFEDLEEKLSATRTKVFLLCSPHNPIGKVWDKEILRKIGHLCAKHKVLVVADEIHCDITAPFVRYIPFASIDSLCAAHSITTLSAGKSFNIADLHTACLVVPNSDIRRKMLRALQKEHAHSSNIFGLQACIAAYTQCEYWLESLVQYIEENKTTLQDFIATHLPYLRVVHSNATYLAWINYSQIPSKDSESIENFCEILRRETGLYVSKGSDFGENGKGFLRMNLATSRERLEDGLRRLQAGCHFIESR
ncbi:pyridoxal phosphate-dependent aminotransferase [Helicobacter aurati]|uniref:cysteine-S-conjugate beta-lyase n=1 Tax=Helicobacter aurati TaxID=137778 RepID=A0A3D8J6D4_9HELI|nr:MalY/PatB family protein [Helicobacter aurati]RDU73067.1 pyridoxal phosphate-dependent aminotransferase [Helicobacter aurati]